MDDKICYLLISHTSKTDKLSSTEVKDYIENGNTEKKLIALNSLIVELLAGGKLSKDILMHVIRFLIPCSDKNIKKMMLIFWETFPKVLPDGKLITEMILVCDAFRKDLQHPNEYIRGATLRFLCRLKHPQLIEPLMPSIRTCLDHKHLYVRKNAILSIFNIYKNFDYLLPDASEIAERFFETQNDPVCKRTAFNMLVHIHEEKALSIVRSLSDHIDSLGAPLQITILDLIRTHCLSQPSEKQNLIKIVLLLLNAESNSVRFGAASTLLSISSSPSAIEAAAKCFVDLIFRESDNNVRLVVLGNLCKLRNNPMNERILQDICLDLLRILGSSGSDSFVDLEVCSKTLDFALGLISPERSKEALSLFKTELDRIHSKISLTYTTSKTASSNKDLISYHTIIIKAVKTCCYKYPESVSEILCPLIKSLESCNVSVSMEILQLLREFGYNYPSTRKTILETLLSSLEQILEEATFRRAIWILCIVAQEDSEILLCYQKIKELLGQCSSFGNDESSNNDKKIVKQSERPTITADGSYSSQSSFLHVDVSLERHSFKTLVQSFPSLLIPVIASVIFKLSQTYSKNKTSQELNMIFSTAAILLLKLLQINSTFNDFDVYALSSDRNRIVGYIHILLSSEFNSKLYNSIVDQSSQFMDNFFKNTQTISSNPEDPLNNLNNSSSDTEESGFDEISFGEIVKVAPTSSSNKGSKEFSFISEFDSVDTLMKSDMNFLNKVIQLTGLSDPIYAEAVVLINQFNVTLDFLIVNQTSDTLQNVNLELYTKGDSAVIEFPPPMVLSPFDFGTAKIKLKLGSTDTDYIYGSIVYDTIVCQGDSFTVSLAEIKLDIADYAVPSDCSMESFLKMWADFAWENKVQVTSKITDLTSFLFHVISATKMKCITPTTALQGECDFLVANLYIKNSFGDEGLANVSVELSSDHQISGIIRIRAKSHGMALGLGQKITASMTSK